MQANNNQAKNPLGYEKLSTLLRKFAVPSIIAMLVVSLYNVVDQIFIGQDIGYLGNAATNVAFPLNTVCLSFSLLIGIGAASRFSLSLGAKKEKDAVNCVGNSFWMALIVGIVYVIAILIFKVPLLKLFGATENVLPYAVDYVDITVFGMPLIIFTQLLSNLIRADGSPRYSMMCTVIGAVINTILDPIFIFTFGMGIKGAALATVIAQVISFVFAFVYLWKFKHVKIDKGFFQLKIRECLKIASLGMSNCLTQLGFCLVQIVMNNSLVYYGEKSIYGADIPLSSFGVVMKINLIVISVFVGIAQGSQPIIGFNYGAEKFDRVKGIYKLEVISGLAISVIAFIAFQFFPQYIINIFGSGNELYMEFAIKSMRIFLFMVLINGIQVVSSNFFSAIGKPIKGIILTLSRSIFFLIPLALILPLFFGVDGVLIAGPVSDTLAFIVSVILIVFEMKQLNVYIKNRKSA